jgi:folate-binding protein YgfZ
MSGTASSSPGSAAASLVAARDACVVCDVSKLALVAIDGPDAVAFLQGQLSSDVAGLADDASQYTSFNSPGGRVLANFLLWGAGTGGDAGFRALIPGDIAPAIAKRLGMYVLRSKVRITDVSPNWARYGVGGPTGAAAVTAAFGAAPAPFRLLRRDGAVALGIPGPRWYVVATQAAAPEIAAALNGGRPLDDYAAWQWLAVRAGIGVVASTTQDKFVAQALNWDALGGVSFRKGCFTGQEIIARTQHLGRLKERLFLFHAPPVPIAAGDRLYSPVFEGQPCGTVVTAAPSPDNGIDLVAVVQQSAVAGGELSVGSPDGPRLRQLPLPYEIPAPAEPRPRAPRL